MVLVTWNCMVTLYASTLGSRCLSGIARAKTPSGRKNRPFGGNAVFGLPPCFCVVEAEEGSERGRAAAEREDAVEVRRGDQSLHGQRREVLRYGVAEERAEDADVVAAAIAR